MKNESLTATDVKAIVCDVVHGRLARIQDNFVGIIEKVIQCELEKHPSGNMVSGTEDCNERNETDNDHENQEYAPSKNCSEKNSETNSASEASDSERNKKEILQYPSNYEPDDLAGIKLIVKNSKAREYCMSICYDALCTSSFFYRVFCIILTV